jgi:hypothetical protein
MTLEEFYEAAGYTEKKFQSDRKSLAFCSDWVHYVFSDEITKDDYIQKFMENFAVLDTEKPKFTELLRTLVPASCDFYNSRNYNDVAGSYSSIC